MYIESIVSTFPSLFDTRKHNRTEHHALHDAVRDCIVRTPTLKHMLCTVASLRFVRTGYAVPRGMLRRFRRNITQQELTRR